MSALQREREGEAEEEEVKKVEGKRESLSLSLCIVNTYVNKMNEMLHKQLYQWKQTQIFNKLMSTEKNTKNSDSDHTGFRLRPLRTLTADSQLLTTENSYSRLQPQVDPTLTPAKNLRLPTPTPQPWLNVMKNVKD